MKLLVPLFIVVVVDAKVFHSRPNAAMETHREMQVVVAKDIVSKSKNALRNSPTPESNVCCDWFTQETCYEGNTPVSCAAYDEGGCPCPEGQEKCNNHAEFWMGSCTTMCCADNEETCYDENYNPLSCAAIAEGGCPCPEGQMKCGASGNDPGYCSTLCCGETEETCYDQSYNPVSCAAIADGGCPCPEGQEKCGALSGYSGYCTTLCCAENEETCFDQDYSPVSCAALADGGCPCPDGQEKCGASSGYAGYCTDVCCQIDEETCYDENYYAVSCAAYADGGCPCPEGQEKCGAFGNYTGYCTTLCCEEQTCYDYNTFLPKSCVGWNETCPCGMSFVDQALWPYDSLNKEVISQESERLHAIKAVLAAEGADVKIIEEVMKGEKATLFRDENFMNKKKSVRNLPDLMLEVF